MSDPLRRLALAYIAFVPTMGFLSQNLGVSEYHFLVSQCQYLRVPISKNLSVPESQCFRISGILSLSFSVFQCCSVSVI